MADAHLSVSRLSKSFGALRAVDAVSFQVNQGELITLLGPSGRRRGWRSGRGLA